MSKDDDIFKGTAQYYSKFRLAYPEDLLAHIRQVYQLSQNNRMLDLGCGTGQLAIPFSDTFPHVIAMDVSEEMIKEGKRVAATKEAENIQWVVDSAENMKKYASEVDFIVSGNSFHWMDRETVLQQAYDLLPLNGGMVILAGGSIWNGESHWQQKVVQLIKKWLGENRRAGSGTYQVEKRHEDYIKATSFQLMEKGEYVYEHTWDIEGVLGYLYSTSFCSPQLLGENKEDFEKEIRTSLLGVNPNGTFTEKVEITYFLLRK